MRLEGPHPEERTKCASRRGQPVSLWPTLRDAVLRTAPQGEEVGLTSSWRSGPSLIGVTFAETLCRRGTVTNVSLTNVSLPAVEDVVAEILHLEDGGVGPPSGRRSRGTSFVDAAIKQVPPLRLPSTALRAGA
jgi:hypothetical protein